MMTNNKVIRSICYFTRKPDPSIIEKINLLVKMLEDNGYSIQTKRVCMKGCTIKQVEPVFDDESLYLSVGTQDLQSSKNLLKEFLKARNTAFNLDLSTAVSLSAVSLLFDIIFTKPEKTFSFAYTFNNVPSSPYFPSATYKQDGFSIGLQPTDLSEDCATIDGWLKKMKTVWDDINTLFRKNPNFLGIDSSIAPLFGGKSSFIHLIKKVYGTFARSVTKDIYITVSRFIKEQNPKPTGLCGIMFPCLEDFELAEEYEKGEFPIERNIYLSLHSGLGIDTYPLGTNESKERVLEILKLLQALSHKYSKPLSARFISDGKARIGEKTGFYNQYLKDVVIREL